MLTIRLLRTGKKNQPFFRIVVTDKKNPPRGGRFLEVVGLLNPLRKERRLKPERIKHWLSVGAQPSATVHNLLVSEKIIEGKKINIQVKSKKKEGKKAAEKVVEAKPEITSSPPLGAGSSAPPIKEVEEEQKTEGEITKKSTETAGSKEPESPEGVAT